MSKEKKPFDHADHLRRLEEADRELTILGRNDLAGAVRRAISLHNEFLTRIYSARNVQRQLKNLRDKAEVLEREMGEYVTRNEVPWIEPANTLLSPE